MEIVKSPTATLFLAWRQYRTARPEKVVAGTLKLDRRHHPLDTDGGEPRAGVMHPSHGEGAMTGGHG